jgi:hypothetical protein
LAYSESGFVRRTSPKALQDYLAAKALKVELLIDWNQPPAKVRKALIDCLHKLPWDDRAPIARDWERVAELTDDLGHDAILRAFSDDREEIIREFEGLKGAHDRALWLFLNKPRDFKRAEEIAFARYYRTNKRYWDGFVGPRNATLDRSEQQQFRDGARRYYVAADGSGDQIELDVFQHAQDDVWQVTMYLADLVQIGLEFVDGALTSRERQLAKEAAITYCPSDGSIDVIAPGGGAARRALAALFVEHLLQSEDRVEEVALREYDLSSLRGPRRFEVDPEDRIHHVEIRMLRLEPKDGKGGRMTFEKTPKQEQSIYERIGEMLGGAVAVLSGFDITRARISVAFMSKRGLEPGRSCTFELAYPNGCTLKDHNRSERLILEKYLTKWRLIVPVGDARAEVA